MHAAEIFQGSKVAKSTRNVESCGARFVLLLVEEFQCLAAFELVLSLLYLLRLTSPVSHSHHHTLLLKVSLSLKLMLQMLLFAKLAHLQARGGERTGCRVR